MWHVLHTAPNTEFQVCKYLALHGVEGYAPQFSPPPGTKPGSVRDRKHRWVFPGYVFFKPGVDFSRWDLIRWAPGVRRMLEVDSAPGTLPDDVIEHLRLRLAERQLIRTSASLKKGQPIVIDSGPLRMVDAIFERNLPAAERVQVLVHLLGRQLKVELEAAMVRGAR